MSGEGARGDPPGRGTLGGAAVTPVPPAVGRGRGHLPGGLQGAEIRGLWGLHLPRQPRHQRPPVQVSRPPGGLGGGGCTPRPARAVSGGGSSPSPPPCPTPSTEYGMYQPGCGLENVLMSWGHDGEFGGAPSSGQDPPPKRGPLGAVLTPPTAPIARTAALGVGQGLLFWGGSVTLGGGSVTLGGSAPLGVPPRGHPAPPHAPLPFRVHVPSDEVQQLRPAQGGELSLGGGLSDPREVWGRGGSTLNLCPPPPRLST